MLDKIEKIISETLKPIAGFWLLLIAVIAMSVLPSLGVVGDTLTLVGLTLGVLLAITAVSGKEEFKFLVYMIALLLVGYGSLKVVPFAGGLLVTTMQSVFVVSAGAALYIVLKGLFEIYKK